MTAVSDIWAGVGLTAGFGVLIAIAELLRHYRQVPAEVTRKLVHTGGGIGCLAIPFLIESHWVVAAVAGLMTAAFAVSRRTGHLRSLHAVGRSTMGTELYPLVIYLLFVLARDRPWLYVICVLVLAVSDAAAALIGSRYGRLRYEVGQDRKSLEGSLVFALITYVVIAVPLLAWPDPAIPGAAECALAALLAALLVTCFEAISTGGRDNLLVPLGTYIVLTKVLRQPLPEIVLQNASFVVIATLVGLSAWRTGVFNVGGALVVMLWVYGCWSLGSVDWALPSGLGLALYVAARLATDDRVRIPMRLAVRAVGPLFAVLAVANLAAVIDRDAVYRFLYGPFLAGSATVTAMICWNRILAVRPGSKPLAAALAGALVAAVVAAPVAALHMDQPWAGLGWLVATTAAAGATYDWLVRNDPEPRGTRNVLTLATITVVAALQWAGVSAVWQPR